MRFPRRQPQGVRAGPTSYGVMCSGSAARCSIGSTFTSVPRLGARSLRAGKQGAVRSIRERVRRPSGSSRASGSGPSSATGKWARDGAGVRNQRQSEALLKAAVERLGLSAGLPPGPQAGADHRRPGPLGAHRSAPRGGGGAIGRSRTSGQRKETIPVLIALTPAGARAVPDRRGGARSH